MNDLILFFIIGLLIVIGYYVLKPMFKLSIRIISIVLSITCWGLFGYMFYLFLTTH
jgi:membrane associated rhomboid family serine protease